MPNIKQTDLLKYLADKFNDNSFNIPFKMGAYEPYKDADEQVHLMIYAPQNDSDGKFDDGFMYDENTYQVENRNFVVMSGGISNGEYTPLPEHSLVSYDVTLSFLVFIDNPISEIIRLAIEEVRDGFIGNLDTLEIKELDFDDEDGDLIETHLRLATTADSIIFGDINEIMGRRYMEYSLTVTMTVSKDVELGNQFEWSFAKVAYTYSWQVATDPLRQPFDYVVSAVENLPTPTYSGMRARVGTSSFAYYISVGTEVTLTDNDFETVIPLIADFGTTQDLESFQTLRSISTTNDKYKQVHNYVKSRGYANVFTFLFNSKKPMIRQLFKEGFTVLETPNIYVVRMKFKELDEDGDYKYETDMQFEKRLVLEEASPSEIVYGEPVVFTVGFSVSGK